MSDQFDTELLQHIVEAALMAAGKPLSINELLGLFKHDPIQPSKAALRLALKTLAARYANNGFELIEVATGFRLQVKSRYAPWVANLWEDKPPRYSRALLETLALIAYRQPVTRGDIEQVRGVAVSSHITRTLLERGWIKIIGHKEVPGRPALFGTTPEFLAYFNLKSLKQLPQLAALDSLADLLPSEADTAASAVDPAEIEPVKAAEASSVSP